MDALVQGGRHMLHVLQIRQAEQDQHAQSCSITVLKISANDTIVATMSANDLFLKAASSTISMRRPQFEIIPRKRSIP